MPNTVKTVQIVVDAKDHASSVLKGIGGALQTAIGTFAGGAALKLATKGFDALSGVIGDCFQESRDAAKGMAQTRTVIKSTGGAANVTADHVADLAGSLSHLTLFSDDAIQAQENLLLTFTNVQNKAGEGNDIFDQTAKLGLDMAQALGTDAAGGAIQLGKALNDPLKGMNALRRLGVAFTDEQENMITDMVAAGNVMGAQKIILAELSKEFGGSAEAAAKADGGFHLLQQRLADVKQTIGDALMPALTTLMGYLSGPGMDIVERYGTAIAEHISTAVQWLFTTGLPRAQAAFATLTGVWQDLVAALKSGDLGKLNFDAIAIFGPDKGQAIIDALQAIRKGWGLARDSVVTFKEAWDGQWKNADTILPLHQAFGLLGLALAQARNAVITFKEAYQGDWKNADTILPLHQAFGLLGISSRTTIDWLIATGFPGMKTGLNDAILPFIPAVTQLADAIKNRLGPESHAALIGLSGDMRETRDTAQSTTDDMRAAFEAFYTWQKGEGDSMQAHFDGWMKWFQKTWGPTIRQVFGEVGHATVVVLREMGQAIALLWDKLIALLKLLGIVKAQPISIVGSGTPGGQSVIGPRVSGPSVRDGISATLPSGYPAARSPSVSPDRGLRSTSAQRAPALTVDLRGASFGAGLTEGQVRGWIAPVLDDALRRWEGGLMRETTDLATRGALR